MGLLQRGVLVLSVVNTVWAVAGLIANPSFATGEATSVQVLGVDFNGWHALAGILAFAPGIYAAFRYELARLYALALVPFGLFGPGIWAIFDHQPMGLWPFEHNITDAILHITNVFLYVGLLVLDARSRRRTA
jgi:hypothetical protein